MTLTGLKARGEGLIHAAFNPFHDFKWRDNPDDIYGGDVVCRTCMEVFWCRYADLSLEEIKDLGKKL